MEGKPVRFVLDTGASDVVISQDAFERLDLRRDYSKPSTSMGLGGGTAGWPTFPVALTAGGHDFGPTSLAVVPVRWPLKPPNEVDGLLGVEVLAGYDLDIDLPHERLVLNRPRRCPSGPPPFEGPSVSFRVPTTLGYKVVVPVRVDGVVLSAAVDTGASRTVLDSGRMGLSAADLRGDRAIAATTVDSIGAVFWMHRFSRFELAGDVFRDVSFPVGRVRQTGFDALLGTDYWRRRRLRISFAGWTITIQQPEAGLK